MVSIQLMDPKEEELETDQCLKEVSDQGGSEANCDDASDMPEEVHLQKHIEVNKEKSDQSLMVLDAEADDRKISKALWLFDSGACEHFTGDLKLIKHKEDCDISVRLANGTHMVCKKKGTARVSFSIARRGVEGHEIISRTFNLHNVYYHPATKNIISAIRLAEENSCSIELLREILLIKDDANQGEPDINRLQNVVAMGRTVEGAYIFESEPSQKRKRSSPSYEHAGDSKDINWLKQLNTPLEYVDPDIARLLALEKTRQWQGLELIPSVNLTSAAVMEVLGSNMATYTKSYPGVTCEGEGEGVSQIETQMEITRSIDKAVRCCQSRALSLFHLNPDEWGVKIQSLSSSTAIFEIYAALLTPQGKVMTLDFPSGGSLALGYKTDKMKHSATSEFYDTLSYKLDKYGYIDYVELGVQASTFRPNLIVAGATGYPRFFDYGRMRTLCNRENAILLADISDISGLIVANQISSSPFDHAHVVTTSTQRSLGGPPGALIFYRKQVFVINGKELSFENCISDAVVFQGGHHTQTVLALAVALHQANTTAYNTYQNQIVRNAKSFAEALTNLGYEIATGGTDNHLVVVKNLKRGDIRILPKRVLVILELTGITADKSMRPDGIRMGTLALTSRGFLQKDFDTVASLFDEALKLALEIQASCPKVGKPKKIFMGKTNSKLFEVQIQNLKEKVERFSTEFPVVGIRRENV